MSPNPSMPKLDAFNPFSGKSKGIITGIIIIIITETLKIITTTTSDPN
jgi:hypothetical protein